MWQIHFSDDGDLVLLSDLGTFYVPGVSHKADTLFGRENVIKASKDSPLVAFARGRWVKRAAVVACASVIAPVRQYLAAWPQSVDTRVVSQQSMVLSYWLETVGEPADAVVQVGRVPSMDIVQMTPQFSNPAGTKSTGREGGPQALAPWLESKSIYVSLAI